ncbi:uncharacterized protein SCHCODRAFT_02589194 [Schizophyllum commune H4-8]|uniref:uncharacterized protein n=1 Tax=Schizophyllum commune (strain H4-8 / FGSC 9210) TaxID=578458 RepID=UPI00215F0DC8|nr:uncharacterized protein SCHCODRAFT_02589194 [Schizophyllum commune H4-8]KAI5887703.1 hypothetical protein SCHCODRAFT_02589194 [Schizophyllum commune H4-8]
METKPPPLSVLPSGDYYFDDGDVVVQVESTLFRIHAYHLRRTTSFFDERLEPRKGVLGAGASQDLSRIVLEDVTVEAFRDLLWFFYESAYNQRDAPCLKDKWERIFSLALTYQMLPVLRAASSVLDGLGLLDEVRKVVLCATLGVSSRTTFGAAGALKMIILRTRPLSDVESRLLGLGATVAVSRAREQALISSCADSSPSCPSCGREAICYRGMHICHRRSKGSGECKHHYRRCPNAGSYMTKASIQAMLDLVAPYAGIYILRRASEPYHQIGVAHLQVLQIGGRIFFLHSYHLRRASKVFRTMFTLPAEQSCPEGATQDRPIQLQFTNNVAFANLMWFFYRYPYKWQVATAHGNYGCSFFRSRTSAVDDDDVHNWESILIIADRFDMEDVIQTALYNLGKMNALEDVRKISLSDRYTIDPEWAFDAFRRLCIRPDPLTMTEVLSLQPSTTARLFIAREDLMLRTVKRTRDSLRLVSDLNACRLDPVLIGILLDSVVRGRHRRCCSQKLCKNALRQVHVGTRSYSATTASQLFHSSIPELPLNST